MQLSIQFVSRGLEFHSQLTRQSFEFNHDETGLEYVTIKHATQQKNHQGDLNSKEANSDKRMYATGTPSCPVTALKHYMQKLDRNAPCLFTHINKEALKNNEQNDIWYGVRPVGKRQFSNFLPDICKNSGISRRYTAHCLRATSLSAMTDDNIPARHIMSLSDHSNEMSLIPYARPSTKHKQVMSSTLTSLYDENPLTHLAAISRCEENATLPATTNESANMSMNSMMNGFITNSSCAFNNCTFSLGSK